MITDEYSGINRETHFYFRLNWHSAQAIRHHFRLDLRVLPPSPSRHRGRAGGMMLPPCSCWLAHRVTLFAVTTACPRRSTAGTASGRAPWWAPELSQQPSHTSSSRTEAAEKDPTKVTSQCHRTERCCSRWVRSPETTARLQLPAIRPDWICYQILNRRRRFFTQDKWWDCHRVWWESTGSRKGIRKLHREVLQKL